MIVALQLDGSWPRAPCPGQAIDDDPGISLGLDVAVGFLKMTRKRSQDTSGDEENMTLRRITRSLSRSVSQSTAPASTPGPTSQASFTSTLIAHHELFFDRLVPLLGIEDISSLCAALVEEPEAQDVLQDSQRWEYLVHRDVLIESTDRPVVIQTVPCRHGCSALSDYLSLRSQVESFHACVKVIGGDLGTITHVGASKVDCLVFPTSSTFFDADIGAAGAVHRRAGPELNAYVEQNCASYPRFFRSAVISTPGFQTGMNLLLHCAGPSGVDPDRRMLLYRAYMMVLARVEVRSEITCAAIASISTGNLRYPVVEASEIAMMAVRDYLRSHKWPLKIIAFVCIDKAVLEAFQNALAKYRNSFSSSGPALSSTVATPPA